MPLKFWYLSYRFILPFALMAGAASMAIHSYLITSEIISLPLFLFLAFLGAFMKPIFFMRECEVRNAGLFCGKTIVPWKKIESIRPYFLGRIYIEIRYGNDSGPRRLLIYNQIKWKDLFRPDLSSEYLDGLTSSWQHHLRAEGNE